MQQKEIEIKNEALDNELIQLQEHSKTNEEQLEQLTEEGQKNIKKLELISKENQELNEEVFQIQEQITAQIQAVKEFDESIKKLKKSKKRFFGCF